jgi:hypothetical protein
LRCEEENRTDYSPNSLSRAQAIPTHTDQVVREKENPSEEIDSKTKETKTEIIITACRAMVRRRERNGRNYRDGISKALQNTREKL